MREYTGWHFTASATEGRDGWPLQAVERLPKGTKPELCEVGLHASRRALDALRYAPGPFVSRVRLSGVVVVGDDKACGTVRTRLAGPVDVSRELRLFAADCAERVLPIFERERPGDLRPREAIETARRDVTGDATDEELDAAWDAAWAAGAAAGAAARAAAWAAAGAAAWDAAGAAVWAARDAAWDAAWAAAWAAARDAAWDAGDAARDAAGDAECRWQEAELTRALLAALEEGE